jgi:hypothetical protein
MTPAI